MNWEWPWIGCWIVFGVCIGAAIGLLIEGRWDVALVCTCVAVFAAVGATLIQD